MVNIDDLNDFPADYYPDLDTPNIDRLAATGVSFRNAHSPVPACNPSRVAILMGMHPEITGITLNSQFDFRNDTPILADKPSLPQHFKNSGYRIVGAGKLFHLPNDDAPNTLWDAYTLRVTNGDYEVPDGRPTNGLNGIMLTNPDGIRGIIPIDYDFGLFEFNDAPNYAIDRTTETPDYERAIWGVSQIEDADSQSQPMFVSVGFYRPHAPNYCPKRHFDLLPEPLTDPPYLATDLDDVAYPMGGGSYDADLTFAGVRDSVDYRNQNARAYVACVAFVDELLGILLDSIDASSEPWTVVLWGDHGWHVGEKNRWQKFTLWDRGTRTTLIMSGAGFTPGTRVDVAVSLLDIYPTLSDYAGLPVPSHLGGRSLRRLLDGTAEDSAIHLVMDQQGDRYVSLKSQEWNYVVNTNTGTEELYNKVLDPNEWTNIANDPANDVIKDWIVPEPSIGMGVYSGVLVLSLWKPRRRSQ